MPVPTALLFSLMMYVIIILPPRPEPPPEPAPEPVPPAAALVVSR